MRLITLSTDFGCTDEYVGVMKGVILTRTPGARIVDLTHALPPHHIERAAWLLEATYSYFPEGSVHVVVVDPGVGGSRRIILLEAAGHLFLAPDNGIVSRLLQAGLFDRAYEVSRRDLFLTPISNTFHGRDIMAPVAAHLAGGLAASEVGPLLSEAELTVLDLPAPRMTPDNSRITGVVLEADRFGNLRTNIHQRDLKQLRAKGRQDIVITLKDVAIGGVQSSYDATPVGGLLAIVGSRNYLEIAANQGQAVLLLNGNPGDEVVVSTRPTAGDGPTKKE